MSIFSLTAILNSRQSLRPVGGDEWIKNSAEAVASCKNSGALLLTSVGMNSWEVPLFFAAKFNVNLQIVAPLYKNQSESARIEYYTDQFKIDSDFVRWTFIKTETGRDGERRFMTMRDEFIIKQADIIIPVSIRPKGSFDAFLKSESSGAKEIDSRFRLDYAEGRKIAYDIDLDRINPELDKLTDGYLIHWTRGANGPWPGETLYDYYDSICRSTRRYSHAAIDAICHILLSGKLLGSGRHMRGGAEAVSFTSLSPSESASLMRYRARYREMSFEPYGIAVRRETAERAGVRPAIYGSMAEFDALSDEDKMYFHSIGESSNWPAEREHRHLGDFDLNSLAPDDIIVIVRDPEEIDVIRKHTDLKVVSFYA